MMTISIRNLDRICLAIVICVAVAFGYVMVQRGIQDRAEIRQARELSEKQANDLKMAEASLRELQANIEANRAGLIALSERIPENAEMGAFLKELTVLMRKRGVGLVAVQPQAPVKDKLFTKIPVRLVFKGSFFHVYALLQDLEAMKRLVIMDKLVIGKNELTSDCQVDLTALVFEREKLPVKS
jgi:Tfp pilus assembly protein PilO